MPPAQLVAADGVTPLRAMAAVPYRAGDRLSQELAGWDPMLQSPDAAMFGLRDDVVARGTDLGRNNGFAAGARQSQIDNVIGANWMLAVEPNWHALGLASMSDDDRDAWEENVEEAFDEYANDPGNWIDAGRRVSFIGQLRQDFAAWFDSGEFLDVSHWLQDRLGPGRARYATAWQNISTHRLSNPGGATDTATLRNGVQLGPHGEPLGYHIRRAHPYDPWLGAESYAWEYFEREDDFGRPNVLHGFVVEGDGMTRGVSPMTPVIEAFRLHDVADRATAKAVLINSIIAAVIETQSGLDKEALETMFAGPVGAGGKESLQIGGPPMRLDRTIVPKMPPGTTLKFTNPVQPAGAAYQQFTDTLLGREAAGLGMSREELSRDYSKTNYSSARASLLGAWKAITGRSAFLERTSAAPRYGAWFEEAVDRGIIELPSMRKDGGTPGFYERRSAWLRHAWIGPGRGHIDPVKERQAYQIGRDTYTDTLQSANAEQGRDWRKVARQSAREARVLGRLNLPVATTASLMGVKGTSDNERPAA